MNRLFLVGIAALFLATGTAHAKNVRQVSLPPLQYDHIYEGRISVRHELAGSLPCRPRSLSIRLNCVYLDEDKDKEKECVIWLASREEIEEAGYTEDALWRRANAACNGWKGYRRLPLEIESDKKAEKWLRESWEEKERAERARGQKTWEERDREAEQAWKEWQRSRE